ncbi:related to Dcl-2 dicer RNA helicase/RNAseIII CAF [Phialocephala subalpina]|uniref:Related to Dcl-2 dicer RNA helicase/RNAseIII CAF n=1 Tax=Phialocephala subalpina TaxID=576137 RepID=A0A1L7X9M6_9HELO|nr:related to Dcl-2 dicer RNA helicase/RNAseIII CAF [Phialocephala subalpina]
MASTLATAETGREDSTIEARAYQTEMLEESLKGNVIVAMDTGSGKTHVAVLRIKKELEVPAAGKVIWFLAPTVQLCLQQLAVLQSQIASVQIKSFTSLDNVDKWSDKATWDAVLTNVNIVVSTYAVLYDALSHAFVNMKSLALIVFDEAHNCIGKYPGSKLMKNYYWPSKKVRAPVPHILGLTASPIVGSNLDGLRTLEYTLDAKCKSPLKQKMDLVLHVNLPTLIQIQYDAVVNSGRRTHSMIRLGEAHEKLDIHEDPEIVRLWNTNTDTAKEELEKALMAESTFVQKQMKSFIRTSIAVHQVLGDWAADAYISKVTSGFIQGTDSKDTKFLGWEDSEKQYLANALRCLGSASDTISIFLKDSISDKAGALIRFLSSCDQNTIGIIFVKERAMAYMLYRLLLEHPDTCKLFCLGMVVGMSKPPVGKHDIFEYSHHETQTKTLAKFRTGKINLLIATSVVEEGIDVPQCNLVICFDEPANLKSFIQRRGRARLRGSKLVMMLKKTSKSRVAEWKELERLMKLQYEMEEKGIHTQAKLEENEMEQSKRRAFRVQSTGAVLDMDTAKGHLECFCSRLSSYSEVHMRPEYIILKEYQEGGQWETPLVRAKVILPVTLDYSLRVHESQTRWGSEKNATKDAAFEAYVALYRAGLVNDHLLPLSFPEHSKYMEEQESLIEVQQQFNPWPAVARAWEYKEKLQRRVLTVKDEAGSTKCQIQMLIPANIPDMKAIRIYFGSSSEWKIGFGPATTIPHSLSIADDTTALLSLSYGHRWEVEQLRHIVLFKAKDVNISSFLQEDLSSISTDRADDTIGLLRDPQNRGHPYLFHKWLPTKPPLNSIQKPHKDHESFPQDQPFVAVKKWSHRSDFLHPIAPNLATNGGPLAEYFTVFPRSLLKIDTLPTALSQFGLLVPSLLHNIEVQLLVGELCATVLSRIEIPDFELIRTAISAPVAQEQENYQKLEFLGDSVLKFFTSIFAASKYPKWPEGYLSHKKDAIVSNSRLCRAGLDRGVDKFILTKTFTGRKWRPIYVDTQLGDQEKTTREMPTKTIADVVESLIGVGWKMGRYPTSLSISKVFLPEIDLPSLEVGRLRLFEIAAGNVPLPADLHYLEKLVGYPFKKKSLLIQSMSHSSYRMATASYDRLEFLGDAILEIIIVTELMKYEEELSHSLMHLYKTSLVNGDYLSFIALEWKITQRKTDLKEDPASGLPTKEESVFSLPLWKFMRHGLPDIGDTQCEVERRHALLRCDIIHALERGKEYPWSLLARVNANKFYSDLVESMLGAVWVDSGSLDACEQVLDRMGILKLMHRLIKDQVHALHPREELQILAKGKKVKYEEQVQKSTDADDEWLCTVCIGEDQIIEVASGVSREEVKTRAAEGAVALLRNANGRSGLPVAYPGRRS